ncbi:probable 6-phosphogluconolactonase 1 isoform X1 [Asparagus officinalis]|uniref:probable 6-phosphogluconolactonase 1 isoform X1 n=1 Tax=Asparagus officinalis TaxID=4686 RepID=UPI00098E27F6|nr:probable 6-phosphogluconolactonase 1 isoform X1 [Asparagus officinalis]XP_020244386.1 probable 6-phosphogluconolactonase 1 isoform X1 [Asparagus officinalis]XP_020244389.1 probable 6-phosphogluconolactonase 1 isoform X1 [Asparagus officinalis]XP_020244390.1 probable 6-phosphogluconolactonase 1 isoform X1 [Asparagus officinalis]XP_020244391.1 probable 6-phosphogluconolactonase 1 isoform X1 [Asparagus officinalis]XP_020244392.1 probable 6-phosphogluconolactonase 1 isoform X1 [Asparagus offici
MASLNSGDLGSRNESRVFESLDELATDLAEYISQLSEISVKERGVFTIALTGGPLISLLGYWICKSRKLCEAPYNKTVDWTKWYVFWADERAVAKNHVDSNYKLTKDEFLSKVSVLNSHIHSINDNVTVDQAATDYEFVIRQLVKVRTLDVSESNDCPKFDLILLSIGSDGHVASLFPGHPALELREDWVTYITNSPVSPPERITFTLPVINSASNVAIVAVGEDKASAVQLSINQGNTDVLSGCSVPARMVQPTEGKLVWFLDKPAASSVLSDQ